MTAGQFALFEEPEPRRLPRPALARDGVGRARYEPYGAQRRCEDCEMVAYERGLQRGHAPSIRRARFKRTQDDVIVLLCAEHKHERELTDPPPSAE